LLRAISQSGKSPGSEAAFSINRLRGFGGLREHHARERGAADREQVVELLGIRE